MGPLQLMQAPHQFTFDSGTPQQQPKKKKNLLEALLPSAGGIAGGAAGAAIGTALLPGIGTIAGGLIGGALGGGGGKVAENALSGEALGNGVAKEAALNGVFSAGPLRLLKFGRDAVGGLRAIPGLTADTAVKEFGGNIAGSLGRGTVPLPGRIAGNETGQFAGGLVTPRPSGPLPSSVPDGVRGLLPERAGMSTNVPIRGGVVNPTPAVSDSNKRAIEAIDATIENARVNGGLSAADARLLMRQRQNLAGVGMNLGVPARVPDATLPTGTANSLIEALTSPNPVRGVADNIISATKTSLPQTITKEVPIERALTSAEKSAARKQALVGAGNNAVGMSFTKAVGNKLSNAGEGFIAKEFRLTTPQQANFKNLHGEEATAVLRKYGISRPEDVKNAIQPLQDNFDSIVSTVPAIGKNELSAGLRKVYEPLMKSPALFEQGLGGQIKAQADELLKLAEKGQIPASKVNELRQTFDQAVNYTQKGAPEYNVIKKTADALRGTLQSAAEKAGVRSADGKTFKEVGLELRKLRNLDDIVSRQSYNGTGNLPIGIGNLSGVGIGGAAGGPMGAIAGYSINAAVNSNAGRRLITNGTLKAGEKLTERGATANPYGLKSVASRVAPVGLAGALLDGAQSEGKNTQQNTATMTNSTSQSMPALYNNQQENATSDPFAPENVRENVAKIISGGGTAKDVSEYVSLATALQGLSAKSAKTADPGYTKPSVTAYSQAKTGINSLNELERLIGQDSSLISKDATPGQSLPGVGGLISRAAGTGNYRSVTNNILNSIARINTGAAMPASEEGFYRRTYLPQPGDDASTVQDKLNNIRQFFSPILSYSGGSSKEDLLSALQGA